MSATPNIDHLTSADFESVYEPSEDSFLFVDALDKESVELCSRTSQIVVEIGTGSGIVITAAAKILGPNHLFVATDINQIAAAAASRTYKANDVCVDVVVGDLLQPLEIRIAGKIDVLLFNPPYVPTPSDEIWSPSSKHHPIYATWAGGNNGREVIDRLLPKVKRLLSARGIMYMIALHQNQPRDIERIMAEEGFSMSVVLSRGAGIERLYLLKFTRIPSP